MAMTPRGWSISALAVELRMDRRTVAGIVARLKPTGESGKAKLYAMADVVEAKVASGAPAPTDFDEAKARKMSADAILAEIEVAKARGEVVSLSVVEKVAADEYAALRAKLLSLPDKMAPLCETTPGVDGKRELLRRCVVEALEELSADDAGDAAAVGYTGGAGEGDPSPDEDEVSPPAAYVDRQRVGRRQAEA